MIHMKANGQFWYAGFVDTMNRTLLPSSHVLTCSEACSEKILSSYPTKVNRWITQNGSDAEVTEQLEDGRIPFATDDDKEGMRRLAFYQDNRGGNYQNPETSKNRRTDLGLIDSLPDKGRFPANLLVSDDVLNDGVERHPAGNIQESQIGDYNASSYKMGIGLRNPNYYGDSGSFSRYFSLDAWFENKIKELPEAVRKTFPFLIVPKASKEERNEGLEGFEEKVKVYNAMKAYGGNIRMENGIATNVRENIKMKNVHPTVKPLALMSYLIILGSRANDIILDPFTGSGTTCIAARILNRKYIGIEINPEYAEIARARIKLHQEQMKLTEA